MTISEAAAVNTLLRLIIGRAPDAYSTQEAPSREEALRAAQLLATKANKVLMAGWRPERVRELWPKERRDVR
jgi:hypothetical protein